MFVHVLQVARLERKGGRAEYFRRFLNIFRLFFWFDGFRLFLDVFGSCWRFLTVFEGSFMILESFNFLACVYLFLKAC